MELFRIEAGVYICKMYDGMRWNVQPPSKSSGNELPKLDASFSGPCNECEMTVIETALMRERW